MLLYLISYKIQHPCYGSYLVVYFPQNPSNNDEIAVKICLITEITQQRLLTYLCTKGWYILYCVLYIVTPQQYTFPSVSHTNICLTTSTTEKVKPKKQLWHRHRNAPYTTFPYLPVQLSLLPWRWQSDTVPVGGASVAFHSARQYLHKVRAAARSTNKKPITHNQRTYTCTF